MNKKVRINGMTCGNCASHVEEALKAISGIKSVKVDLADKSATIELTQPVDDEQIKTAVEDEGYEVVNIE